MLAMFFAMTFKLSMAQEAAKYRLLVTPQTKIEINYPSLEIELVEEKKPQLEIEVSAKNLVILKRTKDGYRLEARDSETLLAGPKAVPVIVKLRGTPSSLKIAASYLKLRSRGWKQSIDSSSVDSTMVLEGVQGALGLRTVSGKIEIKSSRGQLDLECDSCDAALMKNQFNAGVRLNSGKLNVSENLGGYNIESRDGIVSFVGHQGRIDVKASSGVLELYKFSGQADLELQKVKAKLQFESLSRVSVVDQNSSLELIRKGASPLWLDYETENGSLVGEGLKLRRNESGFSAFKGVVIPGDQQAKLEVKSKRGKIVIK